MSSFTSICHLRFVIAIAAARLLESQISNLKSQMEKKRPKNFCFSAYENQRRGYRKRAEAAQPRPACSTFSKERVTMENLKDHAEEIHTGTPQDESSKQTSAGALHPRYRLLALLLLPLALIAGGF